jgi:hypothetical protein
LEPREAGYDGEGGAKDNDDEAEAHDDEAGAHRMNK